MNSPFRKDDYLPRLKQSVFPKRWLFFDTETHIVKASKEGTPMEFKLGYAVYVEFNKDLTIYKRIEYELTHKDELLTILHSLDKKKKKLMVVAHNIKFDLEVLDLPYKLFTQGIPTKPPIVNGMVFLWTIKLGNGSTQLIDSANFAPVSLSKIGKDLGFPKMDINFDNCTYNELMIYCRNDVLVLEKFITEFLKFLLDNDLGSFRSTLASQAMTTFRYKFMTNQPYVSNYQHALDLARKGYYGGRTECFFIGHKANQQFFYVDVNSSYPNSMLSDVFPEQLIMHRDNPSLWLLDNALEKHYVIADVSLDTNAKAFPYRLLKTNIDINKEHYPQYEKYLSSMTGKLIFPIGKYRTVLHHDELKFAREYDMIDTIHTYSVYKRKSYFTDYVNFFYDIKHRSTQEGNNTNRLMSKLFLNSLYGKFGQRYHDLELVEDFMNTECGQDTVLDLNTMMTYIEVLWFGKLYQDKTGGESTYSIPELAGAITCKSRMLLWNYMCHAGLDNVFYIDTDSLILNYEGFCRITDFIDKDKLGALKLEQTSKYIDIRNNKDYSFGDYERIKGVPVSARQTNKDEFQYEMFEGIKMWRKRGAKGAPLLFERFKSRRNMYNKGNVIAQGIVEPYYMNGEIITNLIG